MKTQAPAPNWDRIHSALLHPFVLRPWPLGCQVTSVTQGTSRKDVVAKYVLINLPTSLILCQVALHKCLRKIPVPIHSSGTSALHPEAVCVSTPWDGLRDILNWWPMAGVTTPKVKLWRKTEASTRLSRGIHGSGTWYYHEETQAMPQPHSEASAKNTGDS